MKEYICMSDIGSVTVGSGEAFFALPNIGGDGETMLRVFDSDKEFRDYMKGDTRCGRRFVTCLWGKFKVFYYDCEKNMNGDTVCELTGRYGVYSDDYAVNLVKWED